MIDYGLIARSIDFYEKEGFSRIESPWTVSKFIDGITKPKDRNSFEIVHNGKCLVASGEQSFLYLYLKGFLPKGMFQTTTPCFRDEPFDFYHTKYFIKNELIITNDVTRPNLIKIVETATKFFETMFKKVDVISLYDGSYDIEVEGQELGSYGIRETEFLTWIYGTGCAEPRTSLLIKQYGLS